MLGGLITMIVGITRSGPPEIPFLSNTVDTITSALQFANTSTLIVPDQRKRVPHRRDVTCRCADRDGGEGVQIGAQTIEPVSRIWSVVAIQTKVVPLVSCAFRYSSILAIRSGRRGTLRAAWLCQ